VGYMYIVGRGVRTPPFLTSKAQSAYGIHAGTSADVAFSNDHVYVGKVPKFCVGFFKKVSKFPMTRA
jgi:hypothetical protein